MHGSIEPCIEQISRWVPRAMEPITGIGERTTPDLPPLPPRFAVLWVYRKANMRWQEHGRTETVQHRDAPQFVRAFYLTYRESNDLPGQTNDLDQVDDPPPPPGTWAGPGRACGGGRVAPVLHLTPPCLCKPARVLALRPVRHVSGRTGGAVPAQRHHGPSHPPPASRLSLCGAHS